MSDIKQLKELASQEIARRQARLTPFNWDPEPEDVLALIEVAEKAQAYLDSEGSGCGAEVEREAALRSALSRIAAAESRQGGETS